jgi:hypothetical protein
MIRWCVLFLFGCVGRPLEVDDSACKLVVCKPVVEVCELVSIDAGIRGRCINIEDPTK